MNEHEAIKKAALIASEKLSSVCVFDGVDDEDIEDVSTWFSAIEKLIEHIQDGDVGIDPWGWPHLESRRP